MNARLTSSVGWPDAAAARSSSAQVAIGVVVAGRSIGFSPICSTTRNSTPPFAPQALEAHHAARRPDLVGRVATGDDQVDVIAHVRDPAASRGWRGFPTPPGSDPALGRPGAPDPATTCASVFMLPPYSDAGEAATAELGLSRRGSTSSTRTVFPAASLSTVGEACGTDS